MYFLLKPSSARLSDVCEPLIETYRTVRSHAPEIISALSGMDVLDRDYYYRVRKEVPSSPIERAARFLYLNRAGWNGLYRVNARGQFNVPYGMPRSANVVDDDNLIAAAKLMKGDGLTLTSTDFEESLESAGAGDLVFLDPPYASSRRREGFVDYNEKLFTWDDQHRLASIAKNLQDAGALVIVTNAYNSAIRDLYPTFSEHALVRRSSLAADVSLRGSVAESVFVS
jgi:DNA adenine methylase